MEKKYLNSVDGFIFNSRTTEGAVNSLLENRKPGVVAYPPTDQFGILLSENEIRERAKADEFRILFLGNVIYRKGLHTLLKAVSVQQSAFRIDVVGSLYSEPVYVKLNQEFIAKNHLSSFVFLHGSLAKEALIQKLKEAHILVVPSSYEGFGIVYLEGMGFGLPAIGTTAGAAGEIIEPGQTGYLVAPDASKALAEHIQSLAEDRDTLTRLSLNARRRYLRQPSWTETAKSIRDFLYSFIQ